MKSFFVVLFVFTILAGCGTNYTSHIKDVPFDIDNVYRQSPVQKANMEHKNGTIWPGERYSNTFFSDQRAVRVGDIITVRIIESTTANEKATTDLKKAGNTQYGIPNFLGLEANKYPSSITPGSMVTSNTKSDSKGEGETTRSGSMTAVMSAKVVEVMPNGNLAIEGRREVSVNSERKEILLQGLVRPRDIASDNSILSTQVADAKVILTGVGVVSEKQNPGWLARILDVVWPF